MLIIGEVPTKGSDYTTITTEAKYFINFTWSKRKLFSSCHYNEINNFLFVDSKNIYIYQLKPKISEIKLYPLCLGNTSKYFAVNNIKKKQD